jgi:CYTH domain-containing protein
MYLNAEEYYTVTQLSSKQLTKTRYSVPPFGIDVFEGVLKGLILAESEFESALDADHVELPSFLGCEVSDDERFTGGRLVRAARHDVQVWLAEYGIKFEQVGADGANGADDQPPLARE